MGDTAPPVITSGADLAATAPADLFASIPDDVDSSTDDTTIETPDSIEDTGGDEDVDTDEGAEPEPEPEPEAEPEPVVAKPDATTEEELPEGVVRGKNRAGKEGLFVEDSRWKTIYNNHKLVQTTSEMLGEPATAEALQLRNAAYNAQERLFNDLNSADPKAQGEVVGFILNEMQRARQDGEVGSDPTIPFAQSLYSTLRERAPDAYATLRFTAARDLVGEMFKEAAAKGDESLFLSAQHFARALANVPKDLGDIAQMRTITQRMGIPFFRKDEMQGLAREGTTDEATRLRTENATLKSQLTGNNGNQQAAQFDTWFAGVSQTVQKGVLDDAIKPALASVEAAWKAFPNDYNDLVVDRLHRKVLEVVRADEGFNARIKLLNDQATRAASAQRRDDIGAAIKQAYVNRARLAVEAVKKPIIEFASTSLKERSEQTHARRQAAQTRVAPKGSSATVPRSLTPKDLIQMPGGVFDASVAVKQAQQLLGS